jgi:peptide/nickel transport system substrate-binding protein
MRATATTLRGRRTRWLISALAITALTLTACGGNSDSGTDGDAASSGQLGGTVSEGVDTIGANYDQRDPNGTFRYVFVQNPTNFDPARSSNAFDMIFLRLVYDQLLRQNAQGELEPQLATEWEFVDDDTALVMKLRDDVDFIDGTHFDAGVVKANIDRAKTLETSVHKGALARVADVQVVDEYTVRFNLSGPGGNLPAIFAANLGSMASPAAFDNPDLDQKPVGSGFATLTEYVPGQVSRYERNEDYWDPEAAGAAKYEIYIQTSAPTRLNMLQTGQAELTYLDASQAEQSAAAGLNTAPSQTLTILQMYTNPGKPPFDDFRVRQALEHAIDRQAIVDGVFFGLDAPVAQFMPPDYWAYDQGVLPDDPRWNYDPEKARQLLAEAGYPDGVDFEMVVPSLDDHRAVAEALLPMLAEVGLRATTRVIEASSAGVTFFSRQEGNLMPGMAPPFSDVTSAYQTNLTGQFSNPWNLTTPEFEAAWLGALQGATQEERLPGIAKMVQAEKQIRKNVPILAHYPPSAWTDKAAFPEGYLPAYSADLRYVGVTG